MTKVEEKTRLLWIFLIDTVLKKDFEPLFENF